MALFVKVARPHHHRSNKFPGAPTQDVIAPFVLCWRKIQLELFPE
jgi:hypothetical protein